MTTRIYGRPTIIDIHQGYEEGCGNLFKQNIVIKKDIVVPQSIYGNEWVNLGNCMIPIEGNFTNAVMFFSWRRLRDADNLVNVRDKEYCLNQYRDACRGFFVTNVFVRLFLEAKSSHKKAEVIPEGTIVGELGWIKSRSAFMQKTESDWEITQSNFDIKTTWKRKIKRLKNEN